MDVLGWGFAAIRLVAGLVMVLLIATLVQKWVRETPQTQAPVEIDILESQGGFFSRWGRALWTLFWSTIPVYILAVLVLGAAHRSKLTYWNHRAVFLAAGAGRYGRFSGVRSRYTSLQ